MGHASWRESLLIDKAKTRPRFRRQECHPMRARARLSDAECLYPTSLDDMVLGDADDSLNVLIREQRAFSYSQQRVSPRGNSAVRKPGTGRPHGHPGLPASLG